MGFNSIKGEGNEPANGACDPARERDSETLRNKGGNIRLGVLVDGEVYRKKDRFSSSIHSMAQIKRSPSIRDKDAVGRVDAILVLLIRNSLRLLELHASLDELKGGGDKGGNGSRGRSRERNSDVEAMALHVLLEPHHCLEGRVAGEVERVQDGKTNKRGGDAAVESTHSLCLIHVLESFLYRSLTRGLHPRLHRVQRIPTHSNCKLAIEYA